VCDQQGFFCSENIDFHMSWLRCTQEYDIGSIDYIGNWNERFWGGPDWTKEFRQALDDGGFAETEIVIPDGGFSREILDDMDADPTFASAISAVGLHYPCNNPQPSVFEHPGLKYWASEDYSTVGDWAGAGCWGRLLNQNWVRMNMTSTISWGLIWSVYDIGFPYYGNGLMYAYEPWSGHYTVNGPIWTSAQTCQFTEPGWTILQASPGGGAGVLPGSGSYVTYVAPKQSNFTLVVEKLQGDCLRCAGANTVAETVSFRLTGGLERFKRLQFWSTNETHQFVRHPDVQVGDDNTIRFEALPDTVYTLSSWFNGQSKGSTDIPAVGDFPKPYSDNFDSYHVDDLARFMADDGGSFQICNGSEANRTGQVLKQWVRHENGVNRWGGNTEPITYFGSPNWTDVSLSVDVYIPMNGTPPPPSPPGPEVNLFIINQYNQECLDVRGNNGSAGAPIDIYSCVNQNNELFRYDAKSGQIMSNAVGK
jgi:galactosylceramidase